MSRRSLTTGALSLAGYIVVFGLLARPWLVAATVAQPESSSTLALLNLKSDARLIVFVLTWVARTAWTAPGHLFDLPIYFPAPGQLFGTEHFLSAQLLFAPLFAWTEHPVLAANGTAFLLYPLGAFAMERLVRRLGASPHAAWLAGLVFALGPLRVPASLQTIQYPNVCLPLAYGAVASFGPRPSGRRTVVAAAVITIGLFSSYYMAAMVGLVIVLAFTVEIGVRRWREAMPLGAAALAALGLLALFSVPYMSRPEAAGIATRSGVPARLLRIGSGSEATDVPIGLLDVALSGLGALALLGADGRRRRTALAGVACALVGVVLSLGPRLEVFGVDVPLPFAALAVGPTAFLRIPLRFLVLAGFGTALLSACAFDVLAERLPVLDRRALVAALTAIVVARGRGLSGFGLAPIVDPAAPEVFTHLRTLIEGMGGAVLELPSQDPMGLMDSDAMMHALWHRAPLVTGYTGYAPAHRDFLRRTVLHLPTPAALTDLVAATHVRWLVLKPARHWTSPEAREAMRRGLEASGLCSRASDLREWTVLRVDAPPTHPAWFEAIASGPRATHTVLGTPLAPVAGDGIVARLHLLRRPSGHIGAAEHWHLSAMVENAGLSPWPVSVAEEDRSDLAVGVRAAWFPILVHDANPPPRAAEYLPLLHDVAPGEMVPLDAWLAVPEPGPYILEVAVIQGRRGATSGRVFDKRLRKKVAVDRPDS